MKISKSHKLSEFLDWTRRKLYIVLALAIIPVVLYRLLGLATTPSKRARFGYYRRQAFLRSSSLDSPFLVADAPAGRRSCASNGG
jgi:hypothetical protein